MKREVSYRLIQILYAWMDASDSAVGTTSSSTLVKRGLRPYCEKPPAMPGDIYFCITKILMQFLIINLFIREEVYFQKIKTNAGGF